MNIKEFLELSAIKYSAEINDDLKDRISITATTENGHMYNIKTVTMTSDGSIAPKLNIILEDINKERREPIKHVEGLLETFKAEIDNYNTENSSKDSKDRLKNGMVLYSPGHLTVKFLEYSRLDGEPIFQIISGSASLQEYFKNGFLKLHTVEDSELSVVLRNPRLVSTLENMLNN